MTDDELKAKLLSRREVDGRTGCWVYTGCWTCQGYGKVYDGPRPLLVHQLAARLWLGSSLPFVCRRAGCPRACFNPAHLRCFATKSEASRWQGRCSPPSPYKNGKARLTPWALELIVEALEEGTESHREVAERVSEVVGFPVTTRQVYAVSRGECWRAALERDCKGAMSRLANARKRRRAV